MSKLSSEGINSGSTASKVKTYELCLVIMKKKAFPLVPSLNLS